MTDMIEKCAAHMWKQRARKNYAIPGPWSETPENIKVELREYARAAIEALREPSDQMINAQMLFEDDAIIIWKAMISAALGEQEE